MKHRDIVRPDRFGESLHIADAGAQLRGRRGNAAVDVRRMAIGGKQRLKEQSLVADGIACSESRNDLMYRHALLVLVAVELQAFAVLVFGHLCTALLLNRAHCGILLFAVNEHWQRSSPHSPMWLMPLKIGNAW